MNVEPIIRMSPIDAELAYREYLRHREKHDARDKEIARIYRAISKGKTVISVHDAIRAGGLDHEGRPKLAIMRADQERCLLRANSREIIFTNENGSHAAEWYFVIEWPSRPRVPWFQQVAILPRIPPRHRPDADKLANHHILWEADWTAIPRDPYLLRRIGKDAWVVLAAWDLTDVEMSVLRAHA